MHVDYLSVTMSGESNMSVLDDLTPILGNLGVSSAIGGLYKLHTGGTLKTGPTRGSAHHVSASGGFLEALRAQGLWATYLSVLGDVPHRITRMDVAYDVLCDAPKHLLRFKRKVEAGKVSLTRKKLNLRTEFKAIVSRDQFGNESGTVYVGPKKTQTAGLRVYDKSKEQYDRHGYLLPSTLRWELVLGRKSRVSLRDAWEPDPVFWHYMKDLLPCPAGVPEWRPYGGELSLPARATLLPAVSMKRLVESSDAVSRLLHLADLSGPNGFDLLVRYLTHAKHRHSINPACNSSTMTGT